MSDFITIKKEAINVDSIKSVGLIYIYNDIEFYFKIKYIDSSSWDATWAFGDYCDVTTNGIDALRKKIESERNRFIKYLLNREDMNKDFFGEIDLKK